MQAAPYKLRKHGAVAAVSVEQKYLLKSVSRDLGAELIKYAQAKLQRKIDASLPHIKSGHASEPKPRKNYDRLFFCSLCGDISTGHSVRAHGQMLTMHLKASYRQNAHSTGDAHRVFKFFLA
jgi:hypothetical protein